MHHSFARQRRPADTPTAAATLMPGQMSAALATLNAGVSPRNTARTLGLPEATVRALARERAKR